MSASVPSEHIALAMWMEGVLIEAHKSSSKKAGLGSYGLKVLLALQPQNNRIFLYVAFVELLYV